MRVLLATDGTPGADGALSLLASSFDAARVEYVEVVTVVPTSAADPAYRSFGKTTGAHHEWVADAARRHLADRGFVATSHVLRGHPAERIVDRAGTGDVDLVVLGSRGLEGLDRLLGGSVSTKVARYAGVPVLVARRADPVRRILVGFDGSTPSLAALDFTARLPFVSRPAAVVCNAYDVPAPLMSGIAPTMVGAVEAAYRDDLADAAGRAADVASDAVRRLGEHGIEAVPMTRHGAPQREIARAAEETGADLVVVGDRGRSSVERFLLGSTSAALVAAPPTSVLVGRAPKGGRT